MALTHESFDVGDVVRLNCSSTKMSVDKIEPENADGAIECIWFDDADVLQSARFHPEQLVRVKKAGDF